MTALTLHLNPDLAVYRDGRPRWDTPDHRRHGFHNLHRLCRYTTSFRAGRVMALETAADLRIAELDGVRRFVALPGFSALLVVRGHQILYERYAADFGRDQPHSIQSITKTIMNLVIGSLVEEGVVDVGQAVRAYLPWIGSGYAEASVQDVLDMNVANDYTEDYADPASSVFQHMAAMGMGLPPDAAAEPVMREFLTSITSPDVHNRKGHADYKSANTDVLALIAESASGRPMRSFLADIADATGIEHSLHIATDRTGFPAIDGGASLTARDLARYLSIFVRRGLGVDGRRLGSARFIEQTLHAGIPMPAPRAWLRYSNQTNTDGRWLGHGGYGGQYALADLTSGVVGVAYSVIEDRSGYDAGYYVPMIKMLEEIARLPE